MNTKKIDILNIGLIIVSLIIAIQIPFKLFLLSYAILGPLHYLTEIHWLNQQNYFVTSKKNWIPLFFGLALLICVYPIINFMGIELITPIKKLVFLIATNGKLLILAAFFFAISLIFIKKKEFIIISLIGSLIVSYIISHFASSGLFFLGLLLPTIIHVFLFTLFFMLFGSLKSKSTYGFIAAGLLISIPFVISFISINPQDYNIAEETFQSYVVTNMIDVNIMLAKIVDGLTNKQLVVLSEVGLKIQIFIAFAYTYHYLNWFSKTSIIGWKKTMSKNNIILIAFIWALSVSIYYYDYETGLIALLFLSFLHVFLEFPLNIVSIKEIFSFGFKPKNK
jgi:hypothetical protein